MKPREIVKPPAVPPQRWDALLPCPFCNGAAKMLSAAMVSFPDIGSNACVICTRCGAGGPCVEPADMRPLLHVERHAARLWNRRGSHQSAEWKLRKIAQLLSSEYPGQ